MSFEVRGKLTHRREISRWIESVVPIVHETRATTLAGIFAAQVGVDLDDGQGGDD